MSIFGYVSELSDVGLTPLKMRKLYTYDLENVN